MQKETIIQKLKEQGCRITKQRLMLIDIILGEDCSCCKEIYYKATKKDANIGTATVYRMVNTLEEIGAISRKSLYTVNCDDNCMEAKGCTIELEDDTVIELTPQKWTQIIETGLTACGYVKAQKVKAVLTRM